MGKETIVGHDGAVHHGPPEDALDGGTDLDLSRGMEWNERWDGVGQDEIGWDEAYHRSTGKKNGKADTRDQEDRGDKDTSIDESTREGRGMSDGMDKWRGWEDSMQRIYL